MLFCYFPLFNVAKKKIFGRKNTGGEFALSPANLSFAYTYSITSRDIKLHKTVVTGSFNLIIFCLHHNGMSRMRVLVCITGNILIIQETGKIKIFPIFILYKNDLNLSLSWSSSLATTKLPGSPLALQSGWAQYSCPVASFSTVLLTNHIINMPCPHCLMTCSYCSNAHRLSGSAPVSGTFRVVPSVQSPLCLRIASTALCGSGWQNSATSI